MPAVQRVVTQLQVPQDSQVLDVTNACAEFRGGDEGRDGVCLASPETEIKEAKHRWRSTMEFSVAPAEASAGEDGEPGLAGEGGAHERRRLVWREAQEDLLDKIVR